MTRDEMIAINEELECTNYALNKVKMMGNELAEIATKLQLTSSMVEDGLLDVEVYKKYVLRQKKEMKDILSGVYAYMHMENVDGQNDFVFNREKEK